MSSTDVFVLWLKIAIFYIDLPSFYIYIYTSLQKKNDLTRKSKYQTILLSSKKIYK